MATTVVQFLSLLCPLWTRVMHVIMTNARLPGGISIIIRLSYVTRATIAGRICSRQLGNGDKCGVYCQEVFG